MNRVFWITILLLLLALACKTHPAAAYSRAPHAASKGFRVSVEDARGRQLPVHGYKGQSFVRGEYGKRYVIRLHNQTGRRVEAVVSVDGRDVLSGEPANYREHRGYLIEAHSSVRIEGFRRNLSQVAAFRFTNPGDSYSSRRGTPQHVGIIGVAVFKEKRRVKPRPPAIPYSSAPSTRGYAESEAAPGSAHKRRSLGSADGAGSAMADAAPSPAPRGRRDGYGRGESAPRANNLGTRYGEDRYSPVRHTHFIRANQRTPSAQLALRYDNEEGLLARGIRIRPRSHRSIYHQPQPFPASYTFAPAPENRW